MTSDAPARTGLHPSLVLSAFIEPLLRGRRVAIFGDATIGLADELGRRGARLVHAYDPDHTRAAEAMARAVPGRAHPVSYAVFTGDLGVRDGAFDLIVIPDLSLFTEPAEVLRRARRLIAPAGAAVIVTPNLRAGTRRLLPEVEPPSRSLSPPGYYELYDLVSLQFAKVRMIGQAPFVGYTVADFAPRGEPDVSVDTSFLASSEEPEHFIAIASERPLTVDEYTVVALPWTEVAGRIGSSSAPDARSDDDRIALTETRTRLALMSAELEKLRDRQQLETRDAEARAGGTAALSARVVELELEVERRDAQLRELEGRAGDNHVRAERLNHQLRDLDEELRRQRDRATKLSKQLDDEKKARTKADVELGMIRGAPPSSPKDRERIDQLTAELEAARNRLAELEQEQVETRRRVPLAPHASLSEAGAVADLKLRHRVNELKAAVAAALRESAAATAARDEAIERAQQTEAKAQQALKLEAQLATLESEREALAEQLRALEAQRAEGRQRIIALEQLSSENARELGEAERRIAEGRTKTAQLEQQRAEAHAKTAQLEQLLAESERQRAEASLRAAAARDEKAATEAASAEIAALEASLRERGQVVSTLKRDLLESERIGKELLAELEASRGWNGAPPELSRPLPSAAAEGAGDLRSRLDVLAENAARTEADLQAARWRITQLERELAESGAALREPDAAQVELEAALAAARDEVAALRRAISAR
jgi:SAM-dependent methyltransferase